MAGEALAIMLACRLLKGSEECSWGPVSLWAALTKISFAAVVVFIYVGYMSNIGVSWLLVPCMLLGIAFPLLMEPGYYNSQGDGKDPAVKAWRSVFGANCLNLTGAIVLGALDGDCTGWYCFSEPLPLLPKPCPYLLANPPGSTCPLPLWFNHGAVMHLFAMVACVGSTKGLVGLLECGWQPGGPKDAAAGAKGKAHAQ